MKGYAIFLALFFFSLATGVINELAVVDDDGTSHLVYAGVQMPDQGLDMSEEQMRQIEATGTTSPSALDMINFVGFTLFKMLPMLLSSVIHAFYIVGFLTAWGVPPIMAWCFQIPLWILYGWEIFQIITNRSLKAVE